MEIDYESESEDLMEVDDIGYDPMDIVPDTGATNVSSVSSLVCELSEYAITTQHSFAFPDTQPKASNDMITE